VYETRPLNERFGFAVEARRGARLDDVDRAEVRELLAAGGAVVFRGFPPSVEQFAAFSSSFGTAYLAHLSSVRDREDVLVADGAFGPVQTATKGSHGVNPHSEATYSPMCPDQIWFYCEEPAPSGGNTLLCDGVDLFAALDPALRDALLACTLRWRVPATADGLSARFGQPFADLAAEWFDPDPRCSWVRDGAGEIVGFLYATPAIRETRHGQPAFANNLLGLAPLGTLNEPLLKSVAPELPERVARETLRVAIERCQVVAWRAGDFVMIDNTRVMHGREPFRGERRVLVRTLADAGA
jgi:alpha-ketoglutarate-dependent taurine dioxygenase